MPSTSVSRVAVRMMPSSGGSQRRPSSIAWGMSSRSARSASSWSGLRQQAEEQVARRAVRRLRAGRQQEAEERADLRVVEVLAVELGLHEHRDHVVGGMRAPLGDDRAEVVEERVRRRDRAVELEARADHLDGLAVERRAGPRGRGRASARSRAPGTGRSGCARGRRAWRRRSRRASRRRRRARGRAPTSPSPCG